MSLFPSATEARTLDFGDLVEKERQERDDRRLEELKVDQFKQPELFRLLQEITAALFENDFATAEERARALSIKAPLSPQGWHLLGLALANQGRTDEAIKALDTAAGIYEVNSDPLVIKGDLLLAQGDRDGAQDAYEAAAARDPDDWRAQDSLAAMALDDGDAAAALAHSERAAGTAPAQIFEPRVRLASLYLETGRTDQARGVLEAFAAANPEQPEPLVALGRIAFSEGRNDDAARLFDAAIALAPEAPRLRLFKARADLNASRFEEAGDTLMKGREDFPEDAEFQFELAGLYGVQQDYSGARDAYAEGIAKWPDDTRFLVGLRLANYRLGDFVAALEPAKKLALRPTASGSDHLWHGLVLERLDQFGAAVGAYEAALEADPASWVAANNIATILTETDPDRAVDFARRAAEHAPPSPAVDNTLAWAEFAAGNLAKAEDIYERLVMADDTPAHYFYRYGLVLLERGKKPAAREQLTKALELAPSAEWAADARALVSE